MQRPHSPVALVGHGDLNNSYASRATVELTADPTYAFRSFAIDVDQDDAAVRDRYRPFLLPPPFSADDWIAQLELGTVLHLVESEILARKRCRLRILVLYGSLRSRYVSFVPFSLRR